MVLSAIILLRNKKNLNIFCDPTLNGSAEARWKTNLIISGHANSINNDFSMSIKPSKAKQAFLVFGDPSIY